MSLVQQQSRKRPRSATVDPDTDSFDDSSKRFSDESDDENDTSAAKPKSSTNATPESDAAEEQIRSLCSDPNASFASLGLHSHLCSSCVLLKWSSPSEIQRAAIPWALAR